MSPIQITFTKSEALLVTSIMRHIDYQHPFFYEMLEKGIADIINGYENRTMLVTEKSIEPLRQLHYKVAMALASKELELILSEDTLATQTSTQILSFKQAKVTKTAVVNRIIATLASSDMPLSRSEIAERTSLRVCSVTGRCAEMLKEGILELDEIKLDKDSNRYVQTLKLVK